jgi:hypothetical protein
MWQRILDGNYAGTYFGWCCFHRIPRQSEVPNRRRLRMAGRNGEGKVRGEVVKHLYCGYWVRCTNLWRAYQRTAQYQCVLIFCIPSLCVWNVLNNRKRNCSQAEQRSIVTVPSGFEARSGLFPLLGVPWTHVTCCDVYQTFWYITKTSVFVLLSCRWG